MPVEIKELTIRAKVVETGATHLAPASEEVTAQKEAIISACVEQVLKILKTRKER
ncbi:MAG: DUF5908 family protein [Cyanobacteria bacterium P01_F01_bin.150]